MKILPSIGTACVIWTTLSSFVSASDNLQNTQPRQLILEQTFREAKNILFSCPAGGSSHVIWVLQILEELSARGHNVTFVTKDTHAKFAKNFPMVDVVNTGPLSGQGIRNRYLDKFRDMPIEKSIKVFLKARNYKFVEDFRLNKEVIEAKNPDLIICDHFDNTCIEIASNTNTPFIITSSFPEGEDGSAPYINNNIWNMQNPSTEHMGIVERFRDMFITPIKLLFALQEGLKEYKRNTKTLGIPTVYKLEHKHRDSLKIVNSAFGIEAARPIGPLLEMVGPILSKSYTPLTPNLEAFFEKHRRVLYIAFGQHAIPLKKDVELILKAILHNIENGAIDGILWATRGLNHLFPDYITTGGNRTYDIKSFFDESSSNSIAFVEWAPQMAILNHPSTIAFLTHGGAGSLHEALYTGTRIVVFPFFGDQLGAAITTEKEKLGLKFYHTSSVEFAADAIRRVAIDERGVFQQNVNRFQAFVQLRHKSGAIKGSDLVEEVLFMHQNGKIHHRYDVKRRLSFFKAYNLDLISISLAISISTIYIAIKCIRTSASYFIQKKLKKD